MDRPSWLLSDDGTFLRHAVARLLRAHVDSAHVADCAWAMYKFAQWWRSKPARWDGMLIIRWPPGGGQPRFHSTGAVADDWAEGE